MVAKQHLLINGKPTVVADMREPVEITLEIEQQGVEVNRQVIDTADYVLSEELAVERKSWRDFHNSIKDGRVFRQIKELKEHYKEPILILEGAPRGTFVFGEEVKYDDGLAPNAIRGAYLRIAIESVPIIQTKDYKATADVIGRLALKLYEEEKSLAVVKGKKPKTLEEQKLFVVSSLPNISEKKAKTLLEQFGTLRGLFSASKEDIAKLKGFGKVSAEKLWELFNK